MKKQTLIFILLNIVYISVFARGIKTIDFLEKVNSSEIVQEVSILLYKNNEIVYQVLEDSSIGMAYIINDELPRYLDSKFTVDDANNQIFPFYKVLPPVNDTCLLVIKDEKVIFFGYPENDQYLIWNNYYMLPKYKVDNFATPFSKKQKIIKENNYQVIEGAFLYPKQKIIFTNSKEYKRQIVSKPKKDFNFHKLKRIEKNKNSTIYSNKNWIIIKENTLENHLTFFFIGDEEILKNIGWENIIYNYYEIIFDKSPYLSHLYKCSKYKYINRGIECFLLFKSDNKLVDIRWQETNTGIVGKVSLHKIN
ncbi:MAG: hypothetical protein GY827_04425 [Cytophagales bacterium]|nr:hypothetical protein [Cytophagales bacterium]